MSRKRQDFITVEIHVFFPERGYGFGHCRNGRKYYLNIKNGVEPIPSTTGQPTWLSRQKGGRIPTPKPGDKIRIRPRETPAGWQAMVWMHSQSFWRAFRQSREISSLEVYPA